VRIQQAIRNAVQARRQRCGSAAGAVAQVCHAAVFQVSDDQVEALIRLKTRHTVEQLTSVHASRAAQLFLRHGKAFTQTFKSLKVTWASRLLRKLSGLSWPLAKPTGSSPRLGALPRKLADDPGAFVPAVDASRNCMQANKQQEAAAAKNSMCT
jgi:hypothetical protein